MAERMHRIQTGIAKPCQGRSFVNSRGTHDARLGHVCLEGWNRAGTCGMPSHPIVHLFLLSTSLPSVD